MASSWKNLGLGEKQEAAGFQIVQLMNRLSNHIVSAQTMQSLKRILDKFMDEDDRWNQAAVLIQGLP